MSRLICFTDLETTGLLDPDHRIIEAAVGLYDWVTEARIGVSTWRIDPLRKIDPKAVKTHGITNDDLAGKPTFDVVAPAIATELNRGSVIIAHNAPFDHGFYKQEFHRVGHVMPAPLWYDTCEEGRWSTPYGTIPTLKKLCQCLDVPYDDEKSHGAEYDIEVLAQAFFEGRRLGWFNIDHIV